MGDGVNYQSILSPSLIFSAFKLQLFQPATTLFEFFTTTACARLISSYLDPDFNGFWFTFSLFFFVRACTLKGTGSGDRGFLHLLQSGNFLVNIVIRMPYLSSFLSLSYLQLKYKIGHLISNCKIHTFKHTQGFSLILNFRVYLGISAETYARSQVIHCIKVIFPFCVNLFHQEDLCNRFHLFFADGAFLYSICLRSLL